MALNVSSGGLDVGRCRSIAEVGDVVCSHLSARGVMPSLYLEREELLRCVAERGLWQVLDGLAPTQGVTGLAFREARLIVVDDVSTSSDYLEAIPDVVAEACVPVFADGRPVGALNMDSRRPFDAEDLVELQRCATVVGRWLAGGRTDERSGGVAQLASAVVRMERATSVEDIDQLLLDAAIAISGLPSAMVVRRTGPDRLPAILARGPQRTSLLATDPRDLDSLIDIVLPSRSCYTAGSDDALGMVGTDAPRRAGTRAVVVVPLRPHGGAPALLAVTSSRRRHLHTDAIELLELLAAQATARLETPAHMDELRRQAHEDPLTGIGNRGAFSAALARWLRDGTTGTLAVLDVDGFKSVNDTFGHPEGDRILCDPAGLLCTTVRPQDEVFRMGGDEFAVLLPHVGLDHAASVAERLRALASVLLGPVGADISIGLSPMPAQGSTEAALRGADQRLYDAKRRATLAPS